MKCKKLLVAVSTAAMCLSFTLAASAASTSDIVNKLQADGASATQVAQAQDFFKSNSGAFTSSQLDTVSSNLDKVESIMKANNVTDPTKLPAAAKTEVKSIVASTAAATGVTAEFGKNTAGVTVLTLGKNGTTYTFSANDGVAKTTGSSSTAPVMMLSIGMLLFAGSAAYLFVNRRKSAAA
jgi:hypothetical protein